MKQPSLFEVAADPQHQKEWSSAARSHVASLYAVVEHTPECVKLIDADGRLLDMNAAGLSLIEADSWESVAGANVYDLMAPEHLESFRRFNDAVIAGQKLSLEFEIIALKGTRRWMHSTAVPLKMLNGETVHLAITREITKQKQDQLVLNEITTALDAASDCVFMFDAESLNFVYTNSGATQQVGFPSEDLRRMTPVDIKPHFDRDSFREVLQPLFESPGESIKFRTEHQHRDGHRVPVEISLQLVPELGEAGRFIAIVRDISERLEFERRLEESKLSAEAASRAKSEFLANMSHEIRTPMTAILGYADLLDAAEGEHPDARLTAEAIQVIRSNSNNLLTILNDILDMSKIEAGKMDIECVALDPAKLVSDVAALLRPRAIAGGISLEIAFDSPIPAEIQSDPTRLRQILVNLIGNAIKFTSEGSVTVRTACDRENEQFSFRIEDTGIGLTTSQREMIARFDAFAQADSSTTRNYGGTGLGLRISNAFASMLGGGIDCESQTGQGSAFTARVATGPLENVPFAIPSEGCVRNLTDVRESSPRSVTKPQVTSLQGMRILLAEDGKFNQRLIVRILSRAGAEVTIACDGRVAFHKALAADAEGCPFDLILMDMQMPVMDGYTATSGLRDQGYSGPIIALTAHAMSSDRQKCLDAGCDEYLTKPLNVQRLLEMLAQQGVSQTDCSGREPTPGTVVTGFPTVSDVVTDERSATERQSDGAAASRDLQVLNHDEILQRVGGNIEDLLDLLSQCPRELSRMMQDLEDAVASRNAQRLQEVSHDLKGTFRNLSADRAHDAVEQMRIASTAHPSEPGEADLNRIREEVRWLTEELHRVCSNSQPQPSLPGFAE